MKLKTPEGLEIEGDVEEVLVVLEKLQEKVECKPADISESEALKHLADVAPVSEKIRVGRIKNFQIPYDVIFGMPGYIYMEKLLKSGLKEDDAVKQMAQTLATRIDLPLQLLERRCYDLVKWRERIAEPRQKENSTEDKPKLVSSKGVLLWKKIFGKPAMEVVAELQNRGLTRDKIVEYLVQKAKENSSLSGRKIRRRVRSIVSMVKHNKKKEESMKNEPPEDLVSMDDKTLGFHVVEDKR